MDNYSYPIDYKILRQFAQQLPIFRIETPSAKDISAFHQKGYILYSGICTDDGLKGFLEEVLTWPPVRAHFAKTEQQPSQGEKNRPF